MNAVLLHQIVGSLGMAIEHLIAAKKALEDLLPKEESQEEENEKIDGHEDVVVDLDEDLDDLPRKKKDSSPPRPRPEISLDGKISFSFEGTISISE